MNHEYTNALIDESSPYLLQHAHNPVDWLPWGKEAFEKAQAENKLVLISIGYSSCHWCHVMEHETFEDSTAAAFMNEHFVSIKVDREERPDVDQVYMSAVQLMTRQGGWPLNCFTLPDGRPIYGGTYFPKEQWMDVLNQLNSKFKESPDIMEDYASRLTEGVQNAELVVKVEENIAFEMNTVDTIVNHWKQYWDRNLGGPNRAPKFPLPNNYEFLLHYSQESADDSTLLFVETTLQAMARGGIYDQVGGGFARYSTDLLWKVPHFEKMLYDNAQLIGLYSKAFQATGNKEYHNTTRQTIEFLNREMKDGSGLYYSALDADSEGEEGKFYVWQEQELKEVLGEDWPWLKDYYNVSSRGLWEGNYILLRTKNDQEFASLQGWTMGELEDKIESINGRLLERREKRIRPGLDDKCLTSWNAQLVTGLCEASRAYSSDEYRQMAINLGNAIWKNQSGGNGSLNHSYKAGKSTINGYLEDYAFLIEAYIHLYQITFDETWLAKAKQMNEFAFDHFFDKNTGMFWFTSDLDDPLIARKQEIADNVIPASNSVMAKNQFLLGTLCEDKILKDRARQMLTNVIPTIDFGQSYSNWTILHMWITEPFYEIAITGNGREELRKEMQVRYLPNSIFLGGDVSSTLPLLEGKFLGDGTVFVCQNKTCQLPVSTAEEALEQVK